MRQAEGLLAQTGRGSWLLWAWQRRVFLGLIPAADALGLQLAVGKPRLGEHPVSCLLGDGAGGQRGVDYCLLQRHPLPAVQPPGIQPRQASE